MTDFNQFVKFGLRDKSDQNSGLRQTNPEDKQYTILENTVIVDSRDCIGNQSLKDSQIYAVATGKNPAVSGIINNSTGLGIYPVEVELNSTTGLSIGNIIEIKNVSGNTALNGQQVIQNIVGNTITLNITSNANYKGGGTWNKPADYGYPVINFNDSRVLGNEMIINLNKKLKLIRDLSLYHIVIPRDIIPLTTYFQDFLTVATTYHNIDYGITQTDYTTFIPQEKSYLESRILGFYSSPLDIYRSYDIGNFSIPDQFTPMPLTEWNPPSVPGAWPLQPVPYPYQTVPTFKSQDFSINGITHYLVLSGYGVYDLVDWTANTGFPLVDRITTELMRKLLLVLICQKQSYNNTDYIDMILNCSTTSNNDATAAYGYGDFQRYVPGPGLGQTYQPNTNTWYTNGGAGSGPPNVAQLDSPIPFPNFRGNVWGPYDAPGDRFQRIGARSTLQDLYLNGDLNNLKGDPITIPSVPIEEYQYNAFFGLNFSSIVEVTLGNIDQTTNLNILNAMRIYPNGFGAVNVRANGTGTFYTSVYESAGGQGPSSLGAPSTWSSTGVYGGAGSIDDPLAQGPLSSGVTPANSSSSTVIGTIINRTSFTDLGINNGNFVPSMLKYINYVVNESPDTDLIVKVEESLRDERVQSTRSFNGDAILDVPIRLNIGSTSGTQQYIETVQSLVGNANGYWYNRFFNPKSEITKLHIKFYTYQGTPIPLERMFQLRNSSTLTGLFVRVIRDMNIDINDSAFSNFQYDPLNPQLIGRVKRYIQMIFKVNTYESMAPGLEPNTALKYDKNQFN